MFTGLIPQTGRVASIRYGEGSIVLQVMSDSPLEGCSIGSSIAINGTCLTIIELDQHSFRVEAVPETLDRTTLEQLRLGENVNLELPLRLQDRLDGHMVTGHIDGVGRIISKEVQSDQSEVVWIEPPPEVARYLIPKGSIAIDGVSLTIVDVISAGFSVALIPHTLAVTTLSEKNLNGRVNLEVDMMAKYAERFFQQPVGDKHAVC